MKSLSTAILSGLWLPALAGLLPTCLAAGHGVPGDADFEPEYVLIATEEDITLNCETRRSVVFNGTFPGPTLNLREEKTTWIRVYNYIADKNATVHWHGLSQRTAPFADGTPLISQWPIAPREFFDYEVRPEVGDAGTYFYHSHVGFQAVTAHGSLIVEEKDGAKPPYDYDDELSVVLADYYQMEDTAIEDGLLANPFKWKADPGAILLNGHSGNQSFSNPSDDSCKPAVIEVDPGKTYRVRFIGGTAISFVLLAIEGHADFTIIEADGEYTKPASTDHIQLASGQRFSALLTTKTQEELDKEGKTSYWIRYENRDRPTNISGYGLLQYRSPSNLTLLKQDLPANLPSDPPVALSRDLTEYTKWLEYTLEPLQCLDEFPAASEVTRTVYVTWGQQVVDGFYNGSVNGKLQWGANNLSWAEPTLEASHTEPYLITVYKTGQTPDYDAALANNGWDPKTRAWPARVGEVLDIVWLSNSGPTGGWDFHPMHAHGTHYWDLGSGNGTYDAAENEKKLGAYIPARRDTTMLYRYAATGQAHLSSGWRAWRVKVTEDNVGAWGFHCHVLAHMVMGMQTVWVFGNATDILAEIPSPYLDGYLEYGGSAYGNDTYDPLTFSYFESTSAKLGDTLGDGLGDIVGAGN